MDLLTIISKIINIVVLPFDLIKEIFLRQDLLP